MPLLAPRAKSTTRKRTVNTVITIAAIALAALVVTTTADAAKKKQPAPLPANSVTSKQIKNGAVTAPKLAGSAVTSVAIKDGTITAADLAAGVVPATFVGATAGGALTGTFPNPTLAASAVTSTSILDGAVSVADLAAGSVTSAAIADGTIATIDLAANAVTSAKIATSTILTEDIADSAITGAKIADGSVTSLTVLNGSIGGSDLDTDSINTANLVDDAVTSDKLGSGAVTGAKLDIPAFSGRLGPSLAVSDESSAVIDMQNEHWDTANVHEFFTFPTRVYAPMRGVYRVWANLTWTGGTSGQRTIHVLDEFGGTMIGDRVPAAASGATRQTMSAEVCLNANEYIRFVASVVDNGGSSATIDALESSFGMSLVTPVSACN